MKRLQIKKENLIISQPIPASNRFHVFDKTNNYRSLCGNYMILFPNDSLCEPVQGDETYKIGQDCKMCFVRAGLTVKTKKP